MLTHINSVMGVNTDIVEKQDLGKKCLALKDFDFDF